MITWGLLAAATAFATEPTSFFVIHVLVPLVLATVGFCGMKPLFRTLPSAFLTGSALAAALALINSPGNFADYLGPVAVGWAKATAGSFAAGPHGLAAAAFVSAATALGCALWTPRGAAAGVRLASVRRFVQANRTGRNYEIEKMGRRRAGLRLDGAAGHGAESRTWRYGD